jgi:Spy/CpxP family protein refolding chaperone
MQQLSDYGRRSTNLWSLTRLAVALAGAAMILVAAPLTVHSKASKNILDSNEPTEAPAPSPGADRLPPSSGEAPRPGDPLAIYRAAGIDKNQEAQIRQLAKEFDEANATRLQSMSSCLREMQTLSLKPDPDEQAVLGKQEQVNKLQAEMSIARIKLLLKIRGLLNTEQKQKLVEIMQKGPAPTQ